MDEIKDQKLASSDTASKLEARPPIVVVMGHVDHGKTTLLDYIRKTVVASREAGGITQSIGAYEITYTPQINADQTQINSDHKTQINADQTPGGSAAKRITFIDTPGHEAFSKMRARGVTVADLAILVVAADDGVKPQTKEVIEVLNTTKTPYIVAINKIDKNNADIERTKNDLLQAGVLLEGYGGSVSWHGISAKTGEGVSDLLDLLLLAAELEDLKYNPEIPGRGVIIEAKMDSRRGVSVTTVLRDGILKQGDYIKTPTASGKIKVLEDFTGERVEKLIPSSPALILGFENLPEVGEEFETSPSAMDTSSDASNTSSESHLGGNNKDGEVNESGALLNVILKADVAGSLEALSEIVKIMSDVQIISQSVGEITDGDVKTASASSAIIIGFRVSPGKAAENLAKAQSVSMISSPIIYELIKTIEEQVEAKRSPGPEGEIEILAVFSQKNRKQVVGGRVILGRVKNNSEVKIIRGSEELGSARLINLQHNKKDVHVVNLGEECGIQLDSGVMIAVGDRLVAPAVV